MKALRFVMSLFFVVVIAGNIVYSQSDYQKVENFKKKVASVNDQITDAVTLEDCGAISDSISALREEFAAHKDLLDQALYPHNFESTINKLEADLKLRTMDFSVISDLAEEVSTMKVKVAELTEENERLIGEINTLNVRVNKDAATISELNVLVAQLRKNIQRRDLLVRSMIDSLLADFTRSPTTLNEAEKQNIFGEIENKSLFYNIEKVISDNVSYIEVTEMKVPDFTEMKKEYKSFHRSWKQFGEKLADIYLEKKDKAKELSYIENLFTDWNNVLDAKIWKSINKDFLEKEIKLLPFSNGDEFTSSISAFVKSEIDNIPLKEEQESKMVYDKFMYGVFLRTVQPDWVPFLIDKQLLTEDQKIQIESDLLSWKDTLYPEPDLTWIYILIVVILLVQAVVYISRKRSDSKIDWKKSE